MGKLIDADGLIEMLDNAFNEGLISSFDDFIGIVEEQPTAYDVDEVAEQLKNLKTDKKETKEQIYHNLLIDVAIEIVKAGGKE